MRQAGFSKKKPTLHRGSSSHQQPYLSPLFIIPKILWTLIGLNTVALVIFVIGFFGSTDGRNVGTMEKGWMVIFVSLGVVVILLAIVPLRISQSTFSLSISAFFAALPLVIGISILVANNLPSFKKKQTMAEFYYQDKIQQRIATAIEQGDTVGLDELLKGQNINRKGSRVNDEDGLTYLQFAIRLRDNVDSSFNEGANRAIIRLLVEKGSATTRALAEGVNTNKLPYETISLLLDAGADPNTYGYVNSDPLLFSALRPTKQANDVAILLVRRGADANAKNSEGQSPLLAAATNAGSSELWFDTWRFVRYLLAEAHADYRYTRFDGINFSGIIHSIQLKAKEENVVMPPDFMAVVAWLKEDQRKK